MESAFELLTAYLKKNYDIGNVVITRKTSLLTDLHWKGDDIDEFLIRLINDLSIDVKRLNLSRFHVGDEPMDFFSPLIRWLKREKIEDKETLLIRDVEKFIETGILE
jgi:hypothetical protein